MLPENGFLNGKVGLVVGIANAHSIAAGCATGQMSKPCWSIP